MARKATGPNAGSRKEAARKAHNCQLCGAKTMPAKAKSVIVDPPGTGDVSIVKSREGKSYWCADCAKGKKASYERAIENKANGAKGGKGSGKTKPAGKTARKGTAKKKTAAKKAPAKKGRRKASSKAEPF